MDVTRSVLSLFSIFLGFTFPVHTTLEAEIQNAPNEVSASKKAAGTGNLLLVSRW